MIEFQKNEKEKIRCELSEFKGQKYVNLRVMYLDDNDNWLYSPKGLTLPISLMSDLKKAVDRLAAKVFESLPGA